MFYQLSGNGPHAFVLLHNIGGDQHFFTLQIKMLQRMGKVLVVDLPGHGKSQTHKTYSVDAYAKEIKNLCEQLDLKDIIGIGLNYGGNIFLDIALLFPGLLRALIMIDPPIFFSEDVVKLINRNIHHLENLPAGHHIAQLVGQSFIKANPRIEKIAAHALSAVEPKFLAAIYKDLLLWDKDNESKVEKLHINCLAILTDAALCSVDNLSEHNKQIKIGKVVNSLYWATLEVPEQVNSMIKRFLDTDVFSDD